jgi:hypothetical protein
LDAHRAAHAQWRDVPGFSFDYFWQVHFTGLLALAAADAFGFVYLDAYCSMLPQFASV